VRLKRIELQGFKSFVDRTELEFDQGITAILGPNGCGKSNIVDAVRWVLGEQSPKTLRGDRMDDVIFKGTTKRKPVGLATVTLVFDNADRRLPIAFDEVAIRRRVTRDGNSEYYLNETLCRLKDLRDLLYDSGVNNTSYSIIEHAMINQVLNENNQELRRLIEEGSGITKYKARRRETQRKLERTEQDLLRLKDIIEEIGKEVRSLRYQVGKARRHQRLFQQIRALDLLIAGRSQQELDRREKELRDRLSTLKTEAESEIGELADLRAKIETTRPALDEREAERRRLEDALQAFEEELQESERQVFLIEHRIQEYEQRSRKHHEDLEGAEQRQVGIRADIGQLDQERAGLAEELAQTRRKVAEQSEICDLLEERLVRDRGALEQASQLNLEFIETDAAQLGQLRELEIKQENRRERLEVLEAERVQREQDSVSAAEQLTEREEARSRLSERRRALLAELAQREREETDLEGAAVELQEGLTARLARREALLSRQELLQRIRDEYQGYGQGSQRLLREHLEDGRVLGSLADRIQVPEEWTSAFETFFAELLDAVVVDGAPTAVDLVNELRQGASGQASFLCGKSATEPATDLAAPSGGTPALHLVSGPGIEAPHVRRLLAATWAFADDDSAVAAAAEHRGTIPIACLARSGLLVTSDGVVRGGRREGGEVSLLGRGEKLEKLGAEIAVIEQKITTWQDRQQTNRKQRSELREALLRGRAELEVLDGDFRQLHSELAEARSHREAAIRRLAEIGAETVELQTQLQDLAGQARELSDRVAESGRRRNVSTTQLDELRAQLGQAEAERDQARAGLEELRLVQQRLESRQRETTAGLTHLDENLAELGSRREQLIQEIELGQQERESLTVELNRRREELQDAFTERERRRQVVRNAADAIQDLHDQTEAWHDRAKDIEDRRNACREQMHGLETELATLDVRRRNLQERVEEQYKGSFRELVRSFDPEHLPRQLERDGEVFQLDQARVILADLREKLAALGPVNQLALEEYEAKSERLQFLEAQHADVEKAKQDLATAISRINRTARKLFSDTFEEVRRNFVAVHQVLFEGGHADLQLIRTEDPLESNIHILARPQGKVVDHVGLLSGGERCLTALSLLFAVYLVKPSPFCMLDEVDAPLDDSNIQRFVRMLREFSRNTQFLVVTHNKLTMETANHLYGVTMMEQGCSTIVSVSFHDVAETQSDAELGQAIATRRRELDRRESVRAILADEEESSPRFMLANGTGGRESAGTGEEVELFEEAAESEMAEVDGTDEMEEPSEEPGPAIAEDGSDESGARVMEAEQ
jgi:chromosome segregation protein